MVQEVRPLTVAQRTTITKPREDDNTQRTSPFERVAVDVVGPLFKMTQKNRYITVIADYFTKWPEAFPVQTYDADTAISVLRILFQDREYHLKFIPTRVGHLTRACSRACV